MAKKMRFSNHKRIAEERRSALKREQMTQDIEDGRLRLHNLGEMSPARRRRLERRLRMR